MKIQWISLVVLLVMISSGCGGTGDFSQNEPQIPLEDVSPNTTQPVEVTPLYTPIPVSPGEGDTSSMPDPNDPNFQVLVQIATEDLAERLSISTDQIQLKNAVEVVWPDASLGCAKNPNTSYIQVLTPGYIIWLEALDLSYEYHTDKKDQVIYCENPSALPLEALPNQ